MDNNTPIIEVKIIRMKAQGMERVPYDSSLIEFVEYEAGLRRLAYKNTEIKVDESFFDDSDMNSEYYLTVVYDKITNTPLLSSRYYYDKSLIEKYLKGDKSESPILEYNQKKFELNDYAQVFLADRLSGNISNATYRKHRSIIFSSYYRELVKHNKNSYLLLMVRKALGNKQFLRYIEMGFVHIGSTLHKGREHNIIIGDLKRANNV